MLPIVADTGHIQFKSILSINLDTVKKLEHVTSNIRVNNEQNNDYSAYYIAFEITCTFPS